METTRRKWKTPTLRVQVFTPQEFIAVYSDYEIGFACMYHVGRNNGYPTDTDIKTVGSYTNEGQHGGGNTFGYSGNGNCNTYITPAGRRWERGGAQVPEDGFEVIINGTKYTDLAIIGSLIKKGNASDTYTVAWATKGNDNLWYVHSGKVGLTTPPNLS